MVLCALVLAVSSCGPKKKTLHLYNWADYMSDDVIAAFEAQFDCKVVVDNFDSNETMYAKIKAGATGYDIIFPSSYMFLVMKEQGMVQPLDLTKIPNAKFMDPTYLKLTGHAEMSHGVPYMVSFTGIGYNKTKVTDFKPTWDMFSREDLKGRVTLLNDYREAIGAALKQLGYSLNTLNDDELAQAAELLKKWKGNIAKFDVEEANRGLASGEFLMVQAYNGDVMQVMEENEDLDFVIPQEGTSVACELMAIPTGAPEVELAHAFINFIHTPAEAAKNMEYVYYQMPNLEAQKLLEEDFRNDPMIFPPAEVVAKCESVEDLGENNAKYSKIWDAIKSGE